MSCLLPPGRDYVAEATDWKTFVNELSRQWKLLWSGRISDKVRAEGIASNNFELLFVDRGTVIEATRCYKRPDFREILEQYKAPYEVMVKQEQPSPHVGGWRKFGKKMAASQRRIKRGQRRTWSKELVNKKQNQQLKKGGRGWLHF